MANASSTTSLDVNMLLEISSYLTSSSADKSCGSSLNRLPCRDNFSIEVNRCSSRSKGERSLICLDNNRNTRIPG